MAETLLFYMFATILLASASMVVVGRNPVHSVLFLIVSFFNAAGLFLLTGAELLAMLLVIVYVGAVAVLFLFVVMMLDINFRELRQGMAKYGLIGGFVGLVLVTELVLVVSLWKMGTWVQETAALPIVPTARSNAHALGQVLYTKYFFLFQVSGLVLLVAMIGAIVLTLRQRSDVRKQNYITQLMRTPANTLELKKVKSGQGIGSIQ
jgi:NADH-quinone oxidoreductase subunit J